MSAAVVACLVGLGCRHQPAPALRVLSAPQKVAPIANVEVAEGPRLVHEDPQPLAPLPRIVFRDRDRVYIQLEADADPAWGDGPLVHTRVDKLGSETIVQSVGGQLPPSFAAMRGHELTVYARDGKPCETRIADLRLFAGGLVSFVMEEESDLPRPTDEYWQAAIQDGYVALVGQLEGCDGLLALPKPLVAAAVYAEQADLKLEKRALAATRSLPYYVERDQEWRALLTAKHLAPADVDMERWTDHERARTFAGNGKRFVAVSVAAGGCSDVVLFASLAVVYEVGADGALQRIAEQSRAIDGLPTLLLDIEGDSSLELLTGDGDGANDGVFTVHSGGLTRIASMPFFLGHCGC